MTEEQNIVSQGNTAIISIYILLTFSIICMFTPVGAVMIMGTFMILFTLFLAWCLRFGKDENNYIYSHMIYISRTIWMWSIIASVTTSIAGFLVFTQADNSVYETMLADMGNGIAYSHKESFEALITYIKANLSLMITAGLICFVPIIGYISYRIFHGLSHALKGIRPTKPKAWF